MTHSLSISDGVNTFSLSDGSSCVLMRYSPQGVSLKEFRNGKITVTESIEIWLQGANTAAVQAAKSDLQRLLYQASERTQRGQGLRVYLNWQPMNEASTFRSEIVDAALMPVDTILQALGNAVIPARLVIERKAWREGPETELALTNGNGTNVTGGLAMAFGSGNYLQVGAASVTGDIPAPVRLQLQNTSGASLALRNLYFGTSWDNVASFTHHYEGETTTYGSSSAQATASGGAARSVTLPATWNVIGRWTISAANVVRASGRAFRVMLRTITNGASDYWFRLQLVAGANNAVIWSGPPVAWGRSELVDLGAAPIPPGAYSSAAGAVTLQLLGYSAGGAGATLLDFLQTIGADSFATAIMSNTPLDTSDYVTLDWIEDRGYMTDAGAQYDVIGGRVGGVMVYPGREQRIYTLADLYDTDFPQGSQLTARVYYRPRRLAV